MTRSRAAAVRSLLQDDDPIVTTTLRQQLRQDPALLEAVWLDAVAEDDPCPLVAELLLAREGGGIIQRFGQASSLYAGMLVLCDLHQPCIDHEQLCDEGLALLCDAIPPGLTALEIARFLGDELGFIGDQQHYHDPRNSFLSCVLERRQGLPIALTALWLLVCERLGCEAQAQAIALPGHVLGRAGGHFIDCFAGGRIVSLKDLLERCGALQRAQLNALLEPASERILLARMARNLITSYHILRDDQRMHLARQLSQRAMAFAPI